MIASGATACGVESRMAERANGLHFFPFGCISAFETISYAGKTKIFAG
jgi:hypothetical protein